MAVIDVLPSGHILVTLTPREALMLNDNILDPAEFPWQSSEAQMVCVEVKMGLKGALQNIQRSQIKTIAGIAAQKMRQPSMMCVNDDCGNFRVPQAQTEDGTCQNCGDTLVPAA